MWHNSDERKLKELFQKVQQEPVPDTLHERLQAVVEARFVGSSGLRRLFTMKPLLAGAAGLLVLVMVSALLTTPRNSAVFAAVLDAMEEVKSAHIIVTRGDRLSEIWVSREHGVRMENERDEAGNKLISISNAQAVWGYDQEHNTVIIGDPLPNAAQDILAQCSGSYLLEKLCNGPEAPPYHVSDVDLNGVCMKRIDLELDAGREVALWIDGDSMRVVALEEWSVRDGRRTLEMRARVEYHPSVDPALFTFEPPADATVRDDRGRSKE